MPIPNIPTTKEIKDSIISNIEQEINQNTPLLQKAFNRVLATALAGIITLVYKFGNWIFEQIFTVTQDEESLIKEGEELGVFIKLAQQAELTITITGEELVVMDAGTRFINGVTGLVYSTTLFATIPAGETTVKVNVICLTAGFSGNMSDGTELQLISAQAQFQDIAIIFATVVYGEDREATEDYRSRLLQAKRRKPQGGAIADYVRWTLEVPDVTRAFVFQTSPGNITSYALTDNLPSRLPTPSKLAEIETYLRDEKRKPLNDTVFAGDLTEISFDIEITDINPDTPDIRTAIEANLHEFLLGREPKQYLQQAFVKNIVSHAELVNAVLNSGAIVFVLQFKITGTSTYLDFYTLKDNEIAKLGNLSITT